MPYFTIFIVVLIVGISGGAVWLIFRRNWDENAITPKYSALAMAKAHLYRWATLARAGLHELWQRFQAWRDRKAVPPPAATAPAVPRPPAPRRPAGPGSGVADGPLPPAVVDVTPEEIPPAFAPLLSHVKDFEAEADTDLIAFTRGLAAGDLAYSEALEAQFEHCLNVIRLDPVALQGMADYADTKAEHAQGAMRIGQMINAVYAEVKAFRESGGVLPKDGDFLTGDA